MQHSLNVLLLKTPHAEIEVDRPCAVYDFGQRAAERADYGTVQAKIWSTEVGRERYDFADILERGESLFAEC